MPRNPKRFFTLFILILVTCNLAQTQSFYLGVKTGLNTSYMFGDHYSFIYRDQETGDFIELNFEPGVALRYSGGIVARWGITPSFSLQTELLYTTKGARFNEEIEVHGMRFRLNGDITLGYVELPVLFHFSTLLPDRGRLFYPKSGTTYNVYLGGVAAYRTRATFTGLLTGDIFGAPLADRFENQVWNQFTDMDFGAVIGIGMEYGTHSGSKVFLDLRYTYCFMDVVNVTETNFNLRNTHATLSMGILF
jgi:hypothetical protein